MSEFLLTLDSRSRYLFSFHTDKRLGPEEGNAAFDLSALLKAFNLSDVDAFSPSSSSIVSSQNENAQNY